MCDNNFESYYAYLVDNIEKPTIRNLIKIEEYLDNDELQSEIKNKSKFLLCKNNHELTKYKSDIRKSHFKHKFERDTNNNKKTLWHIEWQSNFINTEIEMISKYKNYRKADILVNNIVLEIQHSYMSKDEVNNRYDDYVNNNNKSLYWIIHGENIIVEELFSGNFLIIFNDNDWRYQSFIEQPFIYIDYDEKIFKIIPKNVKSNMIEVSLYIPKADFIFSLHNNKILDWKDNVEFIQSILYHNQRGAGCGKTYESIQILENDKKFKHFSHKTTIIYLTKMHSAKEVIYNELKEQYDNGKLSSLSINKNGLINDNEQTKQYKINYTKNDIVRTIIIGTIDSFMYSIGNKNHNNKDFFDGIIESIKNDQYEQKSTIKYANDNIKLNKKSLIIIDEAQDLEPKYIEAIAKIMRNTYIDTYIIGDKLQSIWGDHNINTYLEHFDLPNTKIIKDIGKNQVRRFHNNNFIPFVNDIIDFNKYNLPHIEDICNLHYCKYKHENDIIPYNIFEISNIYNISDENLHENNKGINQVIEKIINFMNIEIDNYNYLPNNFMFIFPILSSNPLAKQLEIRIQDFWIEKFKDEKFLAIAKNKDNYWDDYNHKKFNKFIYLHKSDEGKSINLKESENASRILSIHASKGNGCEVVFLLGMNEYALKMFSKQKNNLQYDSLIHVAITRQKKSLYVSIVKNNDDINHRFQKYINFDKTIEPNIKNITRNIELSKITQKCYNDNIGNKYITDKGFEKLLPKNNTNKKIIDWGHHVIRFNVFNYFIYYNIYNNEISLKNSKDQFKTILSLISDIKDINFKYYYEYIDKEYLKLMHRNRMSNGIKEIPILQFHTSDKSNNKYNKYKLIIKDFIINIQKKIKISKDILPFLCPLECVILFHIYDIHQRDYEMQQTSIMDIYSIIYYYDMSFNSDISYCHDDYNCMCSKHFNKDSKIKIKKDDIKNSIIKHYENVNLVELIYKNLKKYITENITTEPFTYHVNRQIKFEKKLTAKEFYIYKNFGLIAFSDSFIINFIIKPQLNILNYKEIIHDSLINNYLILNQDSSANNYDRYNNKKIYNCILTLDNEEPIFYHFYDSNLESDCNIILESIKFAIYDIYSEKNKDIINFYNFCKETKPSGKNSFEYICDKLKDKKYDKLPHYIEDFFKFHKHNLTNNNREEMIKNVSDTHELNNRLITYINDYLNIIDEDNHIEDI